jgi:hypothetical protein
MKIVTLPKRKFIDNTSADADVFALPTDPNWDILDNNPLLVRENGRSIHSRELPSTITSQNSLKRIPAQYSLWSNFGASRREVPAIPERELQDNMVFTIRVLTNFTEGEYVNRNPRPLLGFYFIQLAAHDLGLLGDLLIGTAQSAPLRDANEPSNSGEEGYNNSGISSKPGRAVLAGFILLLGLAFMNGALEATNQPEPPWFFRCAGWIGWILGFGTVGYGTLLVLSLLHPIGPLG